MYSRKIVTERKKKKQNGNNRSGKKHAGEKTEQNPPNPQAGAECVDDRRINTEVRIFSERPHSQCCRRKQQQNPAKKTNSRSIHKAGFSIIKRVNMSRDAYPPLLSGFFPFR
jgi:hypothetical protein